jgi:hypothetical protein
MDDAYWDRLVTKEGTNASPRFKSSTSLAEVASFWMMGYTELLAARFEFETAKPIESIQLTHMRH